MVTIRLIPIGANQTELIVGRIKILFSYDVPVAAIDLDTMNACKTGDFHSVTTSRHIKQWLGANEKVAIIADRFYFERVLSVK